MKEFEFKDIKGLESINTPLQLDTYEVRTTRGLKDRFIFDFSTQFDIVNQTANMIPDSYGDVGVDTTVQNVVWANQMPYTGYDLAFGIPGDAQLKLKDFPMITPFAEDGTRPSYGPEDIPLTYIETVLGPDALASYWTNETETITLPFGDQMTVPVTKVETRRVPYWDKNAAFYLDSQYAGAYGGYDRPNAVKYFRSGYIEFTIKTDNQNCIIGYGSSEYTALVGDAFNGTGGEADDARLRTSVGKPVFIDSNIGFKDEPFSDLNNLKVFIKDGKLCLKYEDIFGDDANSFELIGNTNIADNEWHHVVINFAKPGTLRKYNKKYNKQIIQFWTDGNLDLINDEVINNKNIFFPIIEWLFVDPTLTFGTAESVNFAAFNQKGNSIAFSGALNHFVIGINTALSYKEIKERNNVFRYNAYDEEALPAYAEAKLINPTISTNKKKALKLYWNNLVKTSKNGIELDLNFDVDTVSVTHNISNSISEIYNLNNLNKNNIVKFLPDVKVVITDNVILWGPGKKHVEDTSELALSLLGTSMQTNMNSNTGLDSLSYPNLNPVNRDITQKYTPEFTNSAIIDYPFSNIDIKNGDRILLTGQFNKSHNGIYIFNGHGNLLTRASDSTSPLQLNNGVVRITDGKYANTSWLLSNTISSIGDTQIWIELEDHPKENDISSYPIFSTRWKDNKNEESFINLENDININKYDLIVFMNYPETSEEIDNSMVGFAPDEIRIKYNNFIKSIKNVVANGSSLFVSSPRLAADLGIIKKYEIISQKLENFDEQSAAINPFEFDEDPSRYFDTHRVNQYKLVTEIPGLTDKETYILTDFINYIPKNINEYEQYHAKYSYRQFGLKEGNQFYIPSVPICKFATNEKLPGYKNNRKSVNDLIIIKPQDLISGTPVTELQNTYYNESFIVNNEYDDTYTTIILDNGQLLDGQPITGKIFINFVEDGYTMSREEYNKASIQIIPENEISESISTRSWQYSTTRLNRIPKRINVKELTEYGQTTPTSGGGGALIQAQTNSSNGIIRSKNDRNNIDYQSDLYPLVEEEIYPIQEIPVLSMTWLGIQWLAE